MGVRTVAPGIGDRDVVAWVAREGRVLLAFDKDFGELARNALLPKVCVVVLFRIPMPPPGKAGDRIADLVASRGDWPGYFSLVEPGRVRMRALG